MGNIVMKIFQHKAEPSQRFHTNDVAAFDQRVEDGIVNSSAVTFAEQVIITPHYRRTLISFDRIVVYMIAPVKCVSPESWPQLVGVVEGFAHGVSRGTLGMHLFHPFFHGIHYGYGLGLTFMGNLFKGGIPCPQVGFKRVEQLYPFDGLCRQMRMCVLGICKFATHMSHAAQQGHILL